MAITYGKKFLMVRDDLDVFDKIMDAVGACTLDLGGVFAVLEVGPIKYLIEDTKKEWRLCPLLEKWERPRVDTVNTIPIPKPST